MGTAGADTTAPLVNTPNAAAARADSQENTCRLAGVHVFWTGLAAQLEPVGQHTGRPVSEVQHIGSTFPQ